MGYDQKIAAAFVKVQEDLKNPHNSAYNPISKSRYAPLSDILNFVRPILSKQQLAIMQNVGSTEKGKPFVQTILVHESGETIETRELCLESDSNKRMSTLQEMGSSVTYGKRYQLCAFLGIAPEEDNDGNDESKSSGKNQKTKSDDKPSKPNNNSNSKPENKPSNGKPTNKPKDKPGNGKPSNKPKPNNKTKPTTTKTEEGVEITEVKGDNPNREPAKELNPLLLKIKPISAPLFKKFESVVNQDTITKEMIVTEGQNMLGEMLSQDQLGLIKEELDI